MSNEFITPGSICFQCHARISPSNDLELLFRGVTRQLAVLRNEGVVNTRREGKNIHYSVADVRTLEILVLLHRLYCPEGKN